ncbi:MAG: MurR/RpiR family transcriptional regulator, partial [Clostridiales bacterium]|nr:MurR/RpiR family transcriptional regulator [Clostridiales bacterium]
TAKYITESYDKAAFMTAARLADVTEVSESTVVRFAQELGYGSDPAMRRALGDVVRGRLTSVQRIQASHDMIVNVDIINHVLASDIEQIKMTLDEISYREFDSAVSSIVKADNIYICGLRSSSALALFFGFYLNMIFENVNVVGEHSSLEVFEQIMHMTGDEVFIAMSFPRYSNMTIRTMRYARDMGATIIGITDSTSSPAAHHADISLIARSDMASFIDTLVAPLSVINALIVAVSKQTEIDVTSRFEKLEGIWNEYGVYGENGR